MKTRLFNIFKKPSVILVLILLAFFVKGVFLANLFPIFSGQDEARHYNSVQFRLEPEDKNWDISYEKVNQIKGDFSTYNYSREIRETAGIIKKNKVKSEPYDAFSFNNGYSGRGEEEINLNKWSHYNDKYPPDAVGGSGLYYILVSSIEKLLSGESILIRFFLIRIFGVLLGTLVIYVCYLIAKTIGFTERRSLLFTAIVSFQPALSVYYVSINYDVLLILAFTLFVLGAALSLKKGLNIKNALVMIAAVAVGLFTKATAVILLAALIFILAYFVFKKLKSGQLSSKYILALLALIIFALVVFFYKYDFKVILPLKENASLIESISSLRVKDYLDDSLAMGRIRLTSNSYWGNLGWEDNFITNHLVEIIWAVEAVALLGLAVFLFSKHKFSYLPEKKYLILLMFMIIMLQLGIRYADFKIYNSLGSLDLGAPGRYFLPNLISHIILVFAGIGMLLKKEEYFDRALKTGLILMASYCFYIIFNMVIPRFYL